MNNLTFPAVCVRRAGLLWRWTVQWPLFVKAAGSSLQSKELRDEMTQCTSRHHLRGLCLCIHSRSPLAGKGSSAHLVTNRLAKSVMTPQDGACVGILKQKGVCWGALKAVQKFKI